jgi:phage baseplate assembly protein W
VLFTAPGERPHRPDFGSGVLQLLFQPASAEVATTVHFVVQGTLQQWVGHLVEIGAVEVEAQDSTLVVTVTWTERRTGLTRTETFASGGAR